MESLEDVSHRANVCPILCILKTVLFMVVAVFVLYVPLGDPNVHCQSIAIAQNKRIALCYICDAYFVAVKVANKSIETLKLVMCIILDLLYEAKLGFYAFLEKIDRHDLCRSVCCNTDNGQKERNKEIRCPLCKCVRNRCKTNGDCR